jgi:hypothetical protein
MTKQSSALLINEEPLQVLPTLAVLVGLNESILLQQIHYWLRKPKCGVEQAGRKWIFNSYKEWREQMPFWSTRTIERIAAGLEERGVLITDALGGRDRRKWYTIDYDVLEKLLEPDTHTQPPVAFDTDEPTRQVGAMHDDNLSLSDTTSWRDASRQVGGMENDNLSAPSRQSGGMENDNLSAPSRQSGGLLNKVAENSTENSAESTHTQLAHPARVREDDEERVCVKCGFKFSLASLRRYARNQVPAMSNAEGFVGKAFEECYRHAQIADWERRQTATSNQRLPTLDITTCPDCGGSGWWYPQGHEKGAAQCKHTRLRAACDAQNPQRKAG